MTTVFLERIWTFNQTSKGIEASNVAYYVAEWLIEEQLISPAVTKYQPWNIQNRDETSDVFTGRALQAFTGAAIVPTNGNGTSTFDDDYNIITLWNPIQLVIPDGINWNDVTFEFRVPSIAWAGTGVNGAYAGSGFILWTLWYTGASLFASGEVNIFQWSDINTITSSRFWNFQGISNTGTNMSVSDFYTTTNYLGIGGSQCANYSCTLKLSLLRTIPLADGRTLPFLEYRINFGVWKMVPNQYMILRSEAYRYGFYRTKTVKVPQITTNTALDFAILQ
jgi:hypothetical protein